MDFDDVSFRSGFESPPRGSRGVSVADADSAHALEGMIRLPDMKSAPTYGYNSLVANDAEIGPGTRIGNFVFIRDRVIIGAGCSIGSYVDIEGDVRIGKLVSLQSGCYLTRGVVIEDEVFCGPRVVTLNDKRMCYRRTSLEFQRAAPRILRAARIGGGSVLLPGITVGENSMVGAGSVVTQDVPDRMIVTGNPARPIGAVPDDQII